MPKQRYLEKVTSKIQIFSLNKTETIYNQWWLLKLTESHTCSKIINDTQRTSEHRVLFLYLVWITAIFQTNMIFKTNKCHHGVPGAIAPLLSPLIRSWSHLRVSLFTSPISIIKPWCPIKFLQTPWMWHHKSASGSDPRLKTTGISYSVRHIGYTHISL